MRLPQGGVAWRLEGVGDTNMTYILVGGVGGTFTLTLVCRQCSTGVTGLSVKIANPLSPTSRIPISFNQIEEF